MSHKKKLDFSNSQIAFAEKTDNELRQAFLLFGMMNVPSIVRIGPKLCSASLKMGLPVTPLLRTTIFKQFCGGETLESLQPTLDRLQKSKISTIIDYAVEGGSSHDAKEKAVNELLKAISFAERSPQVSFAVFKATGLTNPELLKLRDSGTTLNEAQQEEWETFRRRFTHITEASAKANVRIFIDAEESWVQNSIDELALAMMRRFNREKPLVFTTIQLYRHDRLSFLKRLFTTAKEEGFQLGVKLVRGAYLEQEKAYAKAKGVASPMQPSKKATDRDFDEAVQFCLANRIASCLGSHNEASLEMAAKELTKSKDLIHLKNDVDFAQLLGMGDHLSYNLAAAGFHVSKYVPYGPVSDVLPYLFRRAEENMAIQGQTGRELGLIIAEMKRRGVRIWL